VSIKKDIVWRVGLVYVAILIAAFSIVVKTLYIQFIEADKWEDKAQKYAQNKKKLQANRGDICARDGRLLASSLPYYQLRMDFQAAGLTDSLFRADYKDLAACLSEFFKDKTKAQYERFLRFSKYKKVRNRYVLINRRSVNYSELKEIKTFPIFKLSRNKGGLIAERTDKRVQPHINLATRTIGYLIEGSDKKIVGRVGLEGAYEQKLRGVDGVSVLQKIPGRWVPITEIAPQDGHDIISCIDIDFQDVARTALLKQLKDYNADHGSAVLMEVKTGAIRAIVNLGLDKKTNSYKEDYNYAIGEATEPGSTFKLASMMALLEDAYVTPDDSIDTGNGVYRFYKEKMKDSHYGGYGRISVKDAFEKSSNIGISKLINHYYHNNPRNFINRLYEFKLNDKLGVEIFGEGKPSIKYPDDPSWSGISLAWMSIGYGLKLTPLQTLTFYNAVANNGRMVKPKFVDEIRYHGNTLEKYDSEVISEKICSQETISTLHKMLEGVVQNGTARNLKNTGYKIAGKTGTAKIADNNKGYSKKAYQASFAGYFPADNPMFSCIVIINNPDFRKGFYGNRVAGPVFKTIADKVYAKTYAMHPVKLDYSEVNNTPPISLNGNKNDLNMVFDKLGVNVSNPEYNNPWVISSREDTLIKYKPKAIKEGIVPNVKGMGAEDAIYILEKNGLKVKLKGYGTVIRQSLNPGFKFRRGQKITIELS
jgi:cell division protein FtsI (penicillin-binding protein 3)